LIYLSTKRRRGLHMLFSSRSRLKIFTVLVSLLFAASLAGCGQQTTSGSVSDELEFTALVSDSGECSTYNFGDSISLKTEFINTAGKALNENSFSELQEQGYTAVFYQDNWESINGRVSTFEVKGYLVLGETINAGELGTMYLGFTRGEYESTFTEVTRIQILKGSKVLLESDVNIDLGSLCVDSRF
jgi:hypothetical protein